jgi:hypothetical protein
MAKRAAPGATAPPATKDQREIIDDSPISGDGVALRAQPIGAHELTEDGDIAKKRLLNLQELTAALESHAAEASGDQLDLALAQLVEIYLFLESLGLAAVISPIYRLLTDANDIRQGANPRFIVASKRQAGRPNATSRDAQRGFLAALIDFLVSHGSTRAKALDIVVAELSSVCGGPVITARQLSDACNRLDRNENKVSSETRTKTLALLKDNPDPALSPEAVIRQTIQNAPPGSLTKTTSGNR